MTQYNKPFTELSQYLKEDFLVVCLGNELRGDDGIGAYIAKRGIEKFPQNFINVGISIENYLFKIITSPQNLIILVDLVDFGGKVGTIKLFHPLELKEQGISTHSISLSKIAEILKSSGKRVLLLGIQGKNINIGEGISPEVEANANRLLKFLFAKLKKQLQKCMK